MTLFIRDLSPDHIQFLGGTVIGLTVGAFIGRIIHRALKP